MRYPEEELTDILRNCGVDFTSSLPCEKIKTLLERVSTEFFHVPLTREEEGVGISAGAALSGKRPAVFVQSSGIGNMINALLSLTRFYELPLAIFVSRRGVYKEKIEAQVPMGKRLPGILKGCGISFSIIDSKSDLPAIERILDQVYAKNRIHAFLLSPAIWEKSAVSSQQKDSGRAGMTNPFLSFPQAPVKPGQAPRAPSSLGEDRGNLSLLNSLHRVTVHHTSPRKFTRYQILEIIAPYLDSKVVVCNLGFPAKELYQIRNQPSNFYMLGSMGMATPIGLGVSLNTNRQVVVIDGDGSLLMNPGSLGTAGYFSPGNLTIFAVDNGTYGSTGDQPTLAGCSVDLEVAAKGFGIKDTAKVSSKRQLIGALRAGRTGLRFVHALAVPGNRDVPTIPISHIEIKRRVQEFLRNVFSIPKS